MFNDLGPPGHQRRDLVVPFVLLILPWSCSFPPVVFVKSTSVIVKKAAVVQIVAWACLAFRYVRVVPQRERARG